MALAHSSGSRERQERRALLGLGSTPAGDSLDHMQASLMSSESSKLDSSPSGMLSRTERSGSVHPTGTSYWSAKKLDPGSLVVPDPTSTQIRANLPSSPMERDILTELQRAASPGSGLPREPRRHPNHPPEGEVPHASESVRSKSKGTRFPSVEVARRRDLDTNPAAAHQVTIFAGSHVGSKDLTVQERGSCAVHIHEAELNYLPAHSTSYPQNFWDAKLAKSYRHVGQLRRLHDELKQEERRKRIQLRELQQELTDRARQAQDTSASIHAGERMMAALENRLAQMDIAVEEAEEVSDFYRSVVDLCRDFPACDKGHLEVLEAQLDELRRQARQIDARTRQANQERRQLELIEKPRLEASIMQNKAMRDRVLRKLRDIRDHQAKAVAEAKQAPQTLAESKEMDRQQQLLKQQNEAASQAKKESKAASDVTDVFAKAKLTTSVVSQLQSMLEYKRSFEVIKDATGLSDPEELLQKFQNANELGEMLAQQRAQYENRLRDLQTTHATMETELQELRYGHQINNISSRRVRELDDTAVIAEVRLHTLLKKERQAQQTVKELKTGILHLARLVGVPVQPEEDSILTRTLSMKSNPLSDDGSVGPGSPKAAGNRSFAFASTGASTGAESEYELSDHMLADLVTRCEERMVAMQEALVLERVDTDGEGSREHSRGARHPAKASKDCAPMIPLAQLSRQRRVSGVEEAPSFLPVSPTRIIRVPSHRQLDHVAEARGASDDEDEEDEDLEAIALRMDVDQLAREGVVMSRSSIKATSHRVVSKKKLERKRNRRMNDMD